MMQTASPAIAPSPAKSDSSDCARPETPNSAEPESLAGSSRRIFAGDVLAGVIGHQRRCDQAQQRARRDIEGDRIRGVKGAEQPSGDERRRAAGDDRRKLIAE